MITHDFGNEAALAQALTTRPFRAISTFYRLLDHAHFHSRIEWARALAPKLSGPRTPEQFFEAWDALHTTASDTEYPACPRWFLETWCKDDQAFRRACRRLWREKQEALADFEGDMVDDWMLDIVPDTVITLLRISLYFAIGFAILNATQLPIDPLTLSLMLVTTFFVWLIEVGVMAIFGLSGRVVRRVLQERKALQIFRQKAGAEH
jgi:hypothetical protein